MISMQELIIHRALHELMQLPMSRDESIHAHLKQENSEKVIRAVLTEIEADSLVTNDRFR